jgi:hypothetical protein
MVEARIPGHGVRTLAARTPMSRSAPLNDRRPAVLGALLLAALVAAWVPLARAPGAPWGPAPAEEPAHGRMSTTTPPSDTATYERMLNAPDLKALVDELEARRRPGDALVAFEVRSLCLVWESIGLGREKAAKLDLPGRIDPSRQAAVDAELRRCSGFAQAELDPRGVVAAHDAAQAWDPRVRLAVSFRHKVPDARPWAERAALAREALASRDPLLVQHVMGLLMERKDGELTWVIEGKRYGGSEPNERELGIASTAWLLSACEYTGTCGSRPLMVQMECRVRGLAGTDCPTEREYHLEQIPTADRPAAEVLAARLLRHLSSGDLSALRGDGAAPPGS